MKFAIYVINKTLEDCNGGSLVLWHHGHALEELGHQFEMIDLIEPVPDDADYVMFQSEWWGIVRKHLQSSKAKRICWLGHYKPHDKYSMPSIDSIDADYFHSQWQGECLEWAKGIINKPIFYMPHGGCSKCNVEGSIIDSPKSLFIGANYPERKQDWLDFAGVSRMTCPHTEAKNLYKSAIVCPNIHGEFQKNIECELFTIKGEMINDRIFNIILSGGFAISDDTPIVKKFFEEDEVPYAKDKEHFKWMIDYFIAHPEERMSYMQKAKERILKEYLYTNYWKEFLKQL